MTTKQRDKEIVKLYKAGGTTYKKLAKQYNVSQERIRQIINPIPMVTCSKHQHTYQFGQICIFHILDDAYSGEFSMTELMEKIQRLQAPNRKAEVVYERKLIMKILKEKYQLSSQFIGRLLKQDITTVKHHLGER